MSQCNPCGSSTTVLKGDAGESTVGIYAYANDASGSGFSLTNGSLNYIAVASFDPGYTPVAADYAGLWFNRTVTNGTNGTTIIYSNPSAIQCNSSTGTQQLNSFQLDADTVAANGDYIELRGVIKGKAISTPNPINIKFSIDGVPISPTTYTVFNFVPTLGNIYEFSVKIFRITDLSATWDYCFKGNAGNVIVASATPIAVDFTANMNINIDIQKLGAQVVGDFNIINYNILSYKQ